MPDWKDIAKLSDREAKTRESQFEAEMLALIAQGDSPTPAASPGPAVTTVSTRDGIQISVTEKGQTTAYSNLKSVPELVRQRIINTWRPTSASVVPPVLNVPALRNAPAPTPRPRTMRIAMFLNLIVPGGGQFYLGQRLAGAVYALSFLACFAAMLAIFLHGYFTYLRLSTSGDILESSTLEQVAHAFLGGILATLAVIGILIYFASAIHLAVSRARQ